MAREAVSHEESGVTAKVPMRIAIRAAVGIPLKLAGLRAGALSSICQLPSQHEAQSRCAQREATES